MISVYGSAYCHILCVWCDDQALDKVGYAGGVPEDSSLAAEKSELRIGHGNMRRVR